MSIAFIVDLAVMVLLLVTIGYCAAVHRKLGELRAAQADMRSQIDRFAAATSQAEGQIRALKQAAGETQRTLGPRVEAARVQADDLDMLIHRAEKSLRRLDAAGGSVAGGEGVAVEGLGENLLKNPDKRPVETVGNEAIESNGAPNTRSRNAAGVSHAGGSSHSERELIKALKNKR